MRPVFGVDSVGIVTNFSLVFITADTAITGTEAIIRPQMGEALNSKVAAPIHFDTGIDLVKLEVNEPPGAAVGYRWPPESATVNPSQFEDLLHHLGLPAAFSIRDVSITLNGDERSPGLLVAFSLYHPEAPDRTWPHQVALSGVEPERAILDFRKNVSLKANARLAEELPRLTTLRSIPVTVRPTTQDASCFECQFKYAGIGPLTFGLGISPRGRFLLSGMPGAEQRRQIAQYLCTKDPNLDSLQHLVRIDSVQPPGSETPILQGELSVLAESVDAGEDLTDIIWSIDPRQETAHVGLDGQHFRDLRGVRGRLRQISDVEPGNARNVAEQVDEYLHAKYPALRGSVKLLSLDSTEQGLLLSVSLLIGEWPEITLGPIPVDADNFGNKLDRLLEPENVIQAANTQWTRVHTHFRYGHVLGRLLGWNVEQDQAEARVQCSIPIHWLSDGEDKPARLLTWVELQRHVGGTWQNFVRTAEQDFEAFSMRALCRQMEPQLAAVERGISDFIYRASGQEMTVTVERNGFGHGVWLRLDPPAIRLRLGLKIPFVPVELHARQVLVDQHEIHYPDELAATYRRTFYIPNPVTPEFNISDPAISVNWRDKGIGIGCKLTPPCPPLFHKIGFTGESDPSAKTSQQLLAHLGISKLPPRIRQDNLWLHFFYAQGELKGALPKGRFRLAAEANVRLLERWDVASGDLRAEFGEQDGFVEGNVRAGVADLPGVPRFDGSMRISRDGLKIRGRQEITGVIIDAHLHYRTDVDPPRITISGRADLPYIGRVDVHGESDIAFERVRIWAKGEVAACQFLDSGHLRYEFFVSDTGGYRLSFYWHNPAGKVEYECTKTGCSVDEIDAETLAAELESRCVATETKDWPTRNASADAKRKISRLPALPSPPPAETSKLLSWDELSRGDAGPQYVPVPNIRCKLEGAKTLRVFQKGKEGQPNEDLLRLKLSDLAPIDPSTKSVHLYFRRRVSGTSSVLLAVDTKNKKIRLLDCPSREKTARTELTKRFEKSRRQLEELNPFGDKDDARAARRAVCWYTSMIINGYDPKPPRPVPGGGFCLSYMLPTSHRAKNHIFCWAAKDHDYELRFTSSAVPSTARPDDVCARLRDLLPGSGGQLVFLGSEDTSGASFLYHTSQPQTLELRHVSPRSVPSLAHEKVTVCGQLPYAECVLLVEKYVKQRPAWRNPGNVPRTVFIGDEGICAVSEKCLILLRTDEQRNPSCVVVSRNAFCRWDHPNQRFLPQELDTEEERETAWETRREHLAQEFVRKWGEHRRVGDWGANPFGMMFGLAQDSSTHPASTRGHP